MNTPDPHDTRKRQIEDQMIQAAKFKNQESDLLSVCLESLHALSNFYTEQKSPRRYVANQCLHKLWDIDKTPKQ